MGCEKKNPRMSEVSLSIARGRKLPFTSYLLRIRMNKSHAERTGAIELNNLTSACLFACRLSFVLSYDGQHFRITGDRPCLLAA